MNKRVMNRGRRIHVTTSSRHNVHHGTNKKRAARMHLNDILMVKIASQLNGCMSTVKVGSVIELLQFSNGFLPRVPNCPELMAVLVSNFWCHRSIQVKDSLKRMSSTRLMVKHPKRDVEASTNQSDDRNERRR
jgi:hypothetical protein